MDNGDSAQFSRKPDRIRSLSLSVHAECIKPRLRVCMRLVVISAVATPYNACALCFAIVMCARSQVQGSRRAE